MNILQKEGSRPFKERRSGKDRRKYIDPRYRNPAYFQFVDRRRRERREPVYEPDYCLIKEHPERKWVARIGMMVALFLIYLLLLSNLVVCKRIGEGAERRCTITIGSLEKYGEHTLIGEAVTPSFRPVFHS